MQSGPINRVINFCPPHGVYKPDTLWELTKSPYGISEAGRQWDTYFEEWILHETRFERISGARQLYV